MNPAAAIYLCVAVGVAWLCFATRRRSDALPFAMMLLISCIVLNAMTLTIGYVRTAQYAPFIDAMCGSFVMAQWAVARDRWKLVLAITFLAQSALHVAYQLKGDTTDGVVMAYAVTLNVIFIGQLALVAFAGGRHVVERWFRRWVLPAFGNRVPRYLRTRPTKDRG